jgi:hypothetical protein
VAIYIFGILKALHPLSVCQEVTKAFVIFATFQEFLQTDKPIKTLDIINGNTLIYQIL